MSRKQVMIARTERNSALVEAMLLAAIADGTVSEREMRTLCERVTERPEFEGTRPEELNALVESSVRTLSAAASLEDILISLRKRLPDHKNRMLAFGLAAAVAFADQRATREELGLLKSFQRALGISEDEVAELVEVVERGGSLAEALGEPLERLYAEVIMLVMAADGHLTEGEATAMIDSLAHDPLFQGLSISNAQRYMTEAAVALAAEGLSRRLGVLAHRLASHGQRLKAFRLAMKIASADGTSPSEVKMLDLLQATFGLADDEVEKIRRETAPEPLPAV